MANEEKYEKINITMMKEDGDCEPITVEAAPYEFTIGTRAKWEMVIADEDVNVKKGECLNIKIRSITLHPYTIALPCGFNQHPIVASLRVYGACGPKPVENARDVVRATVLAMDDGEVKQGDLLGILNVFPVMFTRNARKPKRVREE
ncbi:MAG: DUF22 domain-containing protein [Methermicoccaceae archaeon]